MREQLEKLSRLQELDNKIDKARNMKTTLPRSLAAMESEANALRARMAAMEAETAALEKQRRVVELENTMDSDRIKNIDERLNTIANNKEFHAVAKEAEKARKMITDREGILKQLADKITTQKTDMEKVAQEITDLESKLTERRQEVEKEMSVFDQEANSYAGDREALTQGINQLVMSRYNRIRTRLSVAVTEVVNGSCKSCHVALPPQMYIQVQKGIELINCPSCQRMLYYRIGISS